MSHQVTTWNYQLRLNHAAPGQNKRDMFTIAKRLACYLALAKTIISDLKCLRGELEALVSPALKRLIASLTRLNIVKRTSGEGNGQ